MFFRQTFDEPERIVVNFIKKTAQKQETTNFIFISDDYNNRTFLIDTGSSKNLIDCDALSRYEKHNIDRSIIVQIMGFNVRGPFTSSIGTVRLTIIHNQKRYCFPFHVIPPGILSYNLIGIVDIQQYLIPYINQRCKPKENLRAYHTHVVPEENSLPSYNIASNQYDNSLLPEEQEKPIQKDLIDPA